MSAGTGKGRGISYRKSLSTAGQGGGPTQGITPLREGPGTLPLCRSGGVYFLWTVKKKIGGDVVFAGRKCVVC